MGQAKQRGSYEERKRAGVAKRAEEARRREEERIALEAALTPRQREARSALSTLLLLSTAALAGSVSVGTKRGGNHG